MPIPLIEDLYIAPGELRVRATKEFRRRFLRDDFWVRYEVDGNKPDIPVERALIPFLANVAPIVWLADLHVEVPVLDERFLSALDDVRRAYAQMYPDLAWGGSISASDVPATTPVGGSETTVLFSGGVDSVYTSMLVGGRQMLATVHGADIPLDNEAGWNAVRRQTEAFAGQRGHRGLFIETNFRGFLDVAGLEASWMPGKIWWAAVQHGPGLLGLVAPIADGAVVIAATHSADTARAHGSTPELDGAMAWGSSTVDHHGYVARQAKVEAIVASGPTPLRVCFKDAYGDLSNCERCEKCLRTMAAIASCGGDPRDFEFGLSPLETLSDLRRRLAWWRPPLPEFEAWRWTAIQQAVERNRPPTLEDTDEVAWFTAFDFVAYERRWKPAKVVRIRLLRLLRRFPRLERLLKHVRSARFRRSAPR